MFDTIRYLFWRVWLWATSEQRIDRFNKLTNWLSNDPFEYGLLPPAKELEYEYPKVNLTRNEDVIDFFLQNSKHQCLFARISRLGNGLASMSFYVRLGDKGSWRFESVAVDQSTQDTFIAGGLRIESLYSMRRYRISYNGVVHGPKNGACHLRAIFIGNHITGCGDYQSFHDNHFLAKQLPWGATLGSVKKLDIYVQTFSLTGKIFVEDFEEEVYLWGYRRKQTLNRDPNEVKLNARITAFTENGLGLDLNDASVKGLSPALLFGHLNYPALQERPVQNCSVNSIVGVKQFQIGAARFKHLKFSIGSTLDEIFWTEPVGNEWRRFSTKVVEVDYDGNVGHAMVSVANEAIPCEIQLPRVSPYVHVLGRKVGSASTSHVLRFDDTLCREEPLTGGKGSSLAVLTDISNKNKSFKVPQGVCVTTKAYRAFVASQESRQAIDKLISFCGTQPSNEELQSICEETRRVVASASIPVETVKQIRHELEKMFGGAASSTKLAVRSSACGEDSENMSAAGQMETFLGVAGFEAIASAVAKCWASQFGFVAVQYKRRYGQQIDADMCVVIQEMVTSDVSGVMFTVDPITANPLQLSITANYGLGESVVSAAADPDTFTVARESNGSLSIKDIQLGQKKLSTVLKGSGGTEDVIGKDRSQEQTLSEEQVIRLAKTGLLLETEYASPRDTEWAFHKGELYMLQARPVTSVDNIDSEFEAFHEADSGLVGEFDSITKANVGEVFGGSVSTHTQTSFLQMFLKEKLDAKRAGLDYGQHTLARQTLFMFHHSQGFFHTFSSMGDLAAKDVASMGFSIAMAGRSMDDEIVTRSSANKKKYLCTDKPTPGLLRLLPVFWKVTKSVDSIEKMVSGYSPESLKKTDVRDIYLAAYTSPELFTTAGDTHVQAICYGSLSNVALMSLLANAAGGWTSDVFGDFAALVSSCNNIVSAGVPQSLQKIAFVLSQEYGKKFVEIDPEGALKMLQEGNNESAELFRRFLKDHGHRCLHEFDLVVRPWGMEPLPLVKTLQSMVSSNSGRPDHGENLTIDEILEKMTIKLSWSKRQLLKFILHRVRNGIALRERAKSCLVKSTHQIRRSLRHLARRMVEEGRLPEEDLLFFLNPSEILNLIETRNPKHIVRAMHRMKNAEIAAKNIYPEIMACPPFVPTNSPQTVTAPPTGARSMTGTPVSKGRTVAPARVITQLEDAHLIQKGDVLITYATDIGWSPYFPLISGIVTELGGLISHGAVVAREYGIPCIVGCHGATKLFVSGEEVILDGNRGLIATTSVAASELEQA